MAYPFAAWSWKLLIEELSKDGITYQAEGTLRGPTGESALIQYFLKDDRRYVVTFAEENEIVHPDLIHSICSHYRLDAAKRFGLTLD